MAAFKGDAIFWIETHKIVANPYQPRREFDEHKLKELAESIRMYGVLQPLTVSRKEVASEDGAFKTEYELIAGERRLRASKLAGLEQVPVLIREGEESEQEKLELAIIENLQREDLNAVDRALAFRQLATQFKLSHGEVAKKVGRSREYVSNSIRLLNLPEYMLDSLKVGDISEGHARTFLMLNDRAEEQDTLYRETLMKKLTVREVERIARKIATDKVRKQTWKGSDPELIEKEKQFTERLGTRVQLTKTDYGGKITIDYFSEEDLDALLRKLAEDKFARENNQAFSPVMSAAVAVEEATTHSHSTIAQLSEATPLRMVDSEPALTPIAPPVAQNQTTTAPEPLAEAEVSAAPPEEPITPVPSEAAPAAPETPTSVEKPAAVEPETPNLRSKLAQLFGEPVAPVKPVVVTPPVVDQAPEQPVVAPQPESEAPTTTEPTAEKTEADDDLYGMKNFTV